MELKTAHSIMHFDYGKTIFQAVKIQTWPMNSQENIFIGVKIVSLHIK